MIARQRFLLRGEGEWKGFYRVKPEISAAIDFERLNLVEPFTNRALYHVIFCRNVMMYFDEAVPALDRNIGWATTAVATVGTLFSLFFVINAGGLLAAADHAAKVFFR